MVVGASEPRLAALQELGIPEPPLQFIDALVDTGASCTCIDPGVLEALNLTPTGSTEMHTPSTSGVPHQVGVYDVALNIPGREGDSPLYIPQIAVMATQLSSQGIKALIGRDILSTCVLVYNGSIGLFTLAF